MDLVIRLACVADIPAIFAIRTGVKENHLSLQQLEALGITPEIIREAIEQSPCAWVAQTGEVIVGFAMVDLQDACVFAAFVLPEHEGRGVGRALMQAAEACLFQQHSTIWLETAQASRACGFYQTLGWRVVNVLEEGDVRLEKTTTALI